MIECNYLNNDQIDEFKRLGVLVIPSVLTNEEVDECCKGYYNSLLKHGCDVNNLEETAKSLSLLSSTNGSGGVLDIFYEDWKLRINEHENIVSIMSDLWYHTYSTCNGIYHHPYGTFDSRKGYMYIDRVCYRVPDKIALPNGVNKRKALQRSLTPHLDCCPHKMYDSNKEFPKWRPIQALISLTDTLEPNHGGFEACLGLHSEFDDWIKRRLPTMDNDNNKISDPPCVGEFTPIRPKEDKDIIDRFQYIPCKKGDMIVWDYRIPHANSRYNNSSVSREAIYIGLLPYIDMNRIYAEEQLKRFKQGLVPIDQWHEHQQLQFCDYKFSELGNKLMAISEW